MMGLTYWGPPSCEGLLYSCCIGVVQESNPHKDSHVGPTDPMVNLKGFDSYTSPVQQLYNTPSHRGELHTLDPTPMWEGVV
jgi:hypothetical protein